MRSFDRPQTTDAQAIAALREVLTRANYTAEAIRERIDTRADVLSRHADLPVHVRRLHPGEPLSALIRIFLLNLPIDLAELDAASQPLGSAGLLRLGLAAIDGEQARPLVRIVPHGELQIISDLRLAPTENAPAEHVVGVHGPSITLACLTARDRVARSLDLGTGGGIQAIFLSEHSERVIATDVNDRALDFARFNLLLNGRTNVELRAGSWFEPVKGETFDLIVSNPPYVISPESEYIYRDSGLRGDSASEQVVRAVPQHLVDGGFATVMISWAAKRGEDDGAPVREWLAGTGCDVWLLHYRTEDTLSSAASWNEHLARDPARFGEALDRWLAYYAECGIELIAYGTVVMRKRRGTNWIRTDPLPAGRLQPAADHIRRVFAANDALAARGDDAFLDERLVLVPRHRSVRGGTIGAGGSSESIEVSLEEGVGLHARVDPTTERLLTLLDGSRTVRQAIDAAARGAGADTQALPRFLERGRAVVREMYGSGWLVKQG